MKFAAAPPSFRLTAKTRGGASNAKTPRLGCFCVGGTIQNRTGEWRFCRPLPYRLAMVPDYNIVPICLPRFAGKVSRAARPRVTKGGEARQASCFSSSGGVHGAFYLKKNIVRIKDKNKSEPSKYKRVWNYVPTGLWYGYLILFFAGLTINNTIF